MQPKVLLHVWRFLVALVALAATAGEADAQFRTDCSTASAAAAGVSVGRSSSYFDLSQGVVEPDERGSILIRDGMYLGGRVDLPVAGPWRARVEGSMANWRAERQIYGADFQLVGTDTLGDVKARQIVGMIGLQGGRSPVCAYVLGGGGIYSISYRAASLRRPGVALTAGIEVPTGDHGAVQVDVNLHIINTGVRDPVASSAVLAASLAVGWAYKF